MKLILKLDYRTSVLLDATPENMNALAGMKRVTETNGRYSEDQDAEPLSFLLVADDKCAEMTEAEKRAAKDAQDASTRWYAEFSAKNAAEKKVKELEARLASAQAPAAPDLSA